MEKGPVQAALERLASHYDAPSRVITTVTVATPPQTTTVVSTPPTTNTDSNKFLIGKFVTSISGQGTNVYSNEVPYYVCCTVTALVFTICCPVSLLCTVPALCYISEVYIFYRNRSTVLYN